jgi:hypothetical protein
MKVKDGGVVDGDDVAARTRLPHDFLVGTRRGVLHPVWDNMHHLRCEVIPNTTVIPANNAIQSINTEYHHLHQYVHAYIIAEKLLTRYRAYGVTQFTRPTRMDQAQRRASMLHHHTGARHTSMGVSTHVASCARAVSDKK